MFKVFRPFPITTVSLFCLSASAAFGALVNDYGQINLVSDIPGLAVTTDLNLVNPWGLAASATSPFWVADNGKGVATLYNGAGAKQALTVSIPAPTGGPGTPTGQVFNG